MNKKLFASGLGCLEIHFKLVRLFQNTLQNNKNKFITVNDMENLIVLRNYSLVKQNTKSFKNNIIGRKRAELKACTKSYSCRETKSYNCTNSNSV